VCWPSLHAHAFCVCVGQACMCTRFVCVLAKPACARVLCVCWPSLHAHAFCVCWPRLHAHAFCECWPSLHAHAFCECWPSLHAHVRCTRFVCVYVFTGCAFCHSSQLHTHAHASYACLLLCVRDLIVLHKRAAQVQNASRSVLFAVAVS
jgi:hypothetical protein